MCSILGYFGNDLTKTEVEKALNETYMRGPDAQKLIQDDFGYMGFLRLSIMGISDAGMQPFEREGNYIVCNGELYGFRKLKKQLEEKQYQFVSESDCELLLPLYEEYGVEMFGKLDAEFACILYDKQNNRVLAARDPIGIRPLFYGYSKEGSLALASEARNLVGIVGEIKPFPPGHYMVYELDGEQKEATFVCYEDITKVEEYNQDSLEQIFESIHDLLEDGIKKRLDADVPLGYLLSGGLDSSLVCAIAAKIDKKPIKTFAIGMDVDAIDLKYAKQVADYIGSEHTEIIMTKAEVLDTLEEVISVLGTYDITTIRASMGMYLICKAIHSNTDLKVLLTGEISDELFGYKYTDFAPSAEAFQEESAKRVKELYFYDVLRADRCLGANSLEARVPFGDLAFARYVMSIHPEKKQNTYGMGKYLLRKAFEKDQILPEEILWREKAAFSDAVGHSMVDDIKEYAENYYTDEAFETLKGKYTHATPFTKESLLYREIFEKYYPNQSKMVPDFWMPNKEWQGCDVNDPSARVLKNYGNSGV